MNAAFAAVLLASTVVLTIPVQEVKAHPPVEAGMICETGYDEGTTFAYGECNLQCGLHSAGKGTSHVIGGAIGLPPEVAADNGCVPGAGCRLILTCAGSDSYDHSHDFKLCAVEASGFGYVNVVGGCTATDEECISCSAPLFAATASDLQSSVQSVHHIWAQDFSVANLAIGDSVCAPADGTEAVGLQVPDLNHCVKVAENALWMFAGPASYYPVAFYCDDGASCVQGIWL